LFYFLWKFNRQAVVVVVERRKIFWKEGKIYSESKLVDPLAALGMGLAFVRVFK
jgi:hypothetical protein